MRKRNEFKIKTSYQKKDKRLNIIQLFQLRKG